MSTTLRVGIYARRSDPSGAPERSIEEQVTECRRWAAEQGHVVVVVYEERYSGATGEDRPEFQRALADAKAGKFDILLTWKLDRFGRTDTDEAGHYRWLLRHAGVEVHHVVEGARYEGEAGDLVRTVDQHAARKLLFDIAANTVRGQRAAVLRGSWPNAPAPYGYRLVRREDTKAGRAFVTLEIMDAEAKLVRRLYDLRLTGLGCSAIARLLNEEMIPAPGAGSWGRGTVSRLLGNPVYQGDIARGTKRRGYQRKPPKFFGCAAEGLVSAERALDAGGVVQRGAVPAIVSRDVWERAQWKQDSETPSIAGCRTSSPTPEVHTMGVLPDREGPTRWPPAVQRDARSLPLTPFEPRALPQVADADALMPLGRIGA